MQANIPINILLYSNSSSAHSMIIRGYEEYLNGDKYYSLIDPRTSNYINITVPDAEKNLYIISNNQKLYWKISIA